MRLPSRSHVDDAPALGVADRRHGRAQHERVEQHDALEHLADDARRERLAVDDDVGQLGHRVRPFVRERARSASATCATGAVHSPKRAWRKMRSSGTTASDRAPGASASSC